MTKITPWDSTPKELDHIEIVLTCFELSETATLDVFSRCEKHTWCKYVANCQTCLALCCFFYEMCRLQLKGVVFLIFFGCFLSNLCNFIWFLIDFAIFCYIVLIVNLYITDTNIQIQGLAFIGQLAPTLLGGRYRNPLLAICYVKLHHIYVNSYQISWNYIKLCIKMC